MNKLKELGQKSVMGSNHPIFESDKNNSRKRTIVNNTMFITPPGATSEVFCK